MNQLGIADDSQIPGLTSLARTMRQAGGLAGIQLSHGGGKSSALLTGGSLQGPSAVAVPVKGAALEVPRAMDFYDIEMWKASFIAAADRAVAAGFDWLELHSAHVYGLNQWLSPLTNRREDGYGGDLRARSRLLREIVAAIRLRHSSIVISVRLPGQDFLEGGLSLEEMIRVAGWLQTLGVDVFHVSSGIGGWRRPSSRVGEGYLVAEAAAIQAAVGVPVIGVGGIETGDYIDRALRTGQFSLAAVGRAVLQDPGGWGARHLRTGPQSRFIRQALR